MEPATYITPSARYYLLEDLDFCIDERTNISNILGTGLAKKLIIESYRELKRIKENYKTN
ncbi:MAG: hypothetical protein WCX73_02310 [Candidatus Pacearchaeota archaeon]|jgi:hypothetical protein